MPLIFGSKDFPYDANEVFTLIFTLTFPMLNVSRVSYF